MREKTKKRQFLPPITFVSFLWIFYLAPAFVSAAPPPNIRYEPLSYVPPKAERVQLSNGLIVYLLEDHELPLFRLSLRIHASPADEKVPDSLSFFGAVWRGGGTKTRKPDELNEELERLSASIETAAGLEEISCSVSSLSGDAPRVLELFGDLLLQPAFRQDKLDLAKAKVLESLRRRNDAPGNITQRLLRDVIYGRAHVYARDPTPASVGRVRRADLLALHRELVVPQTAILVVSGDFEKGDLILRLEKLLSAWKKTARTVSAYDYSVQNPPSGALFFVRREINQSRVYLGALGIGQHDPDHFSLTLANAILGDLGGSRLWKNVRSREGLAYAVGSYFTEPEGKGVVALGGSTKGSTTVTFLRALQKELDGMTEQPVSPEELSLAKDAVVNSYVFRFNSPFAIAAEQANVEFEKYPADYLDTYIDKLRGVASNDILNVAQRYFDKGKMKAVIVGDDKLFGEPLATMGTVVDVPLNKID